MINFNSWVTNIYIYERAIINLIINIDMKTLNYFKNVGLLILVLMCFNCSTETINENSSNDIESQTFEKQGELTVTDPCHSSNTTDIYIEYDFSTTFPTQYDVQKASFEHEMSKHFRICSVIESDCPNVDKWIVNTQEYNAYNPIKGAGTSNNVVEGVPGDTIPYAECF